MDFMSNISTAVWLLYLLSASEAKPYNMVKKIYDLSYTFDNSTVYWPTELAHRFKFTSKFSTTTSKYYYATNTFRAAEHGGTHIDAPSHFNKKGLSVADIPMSSLIGNGVVVDVEGKTKDNADYLISVSDFKEWEKSYGRIPDETIVFLRTGWDKKYPNVTEYLGSASTNTSLLHFPGLSETGAKWLVNDRKVKAVGIDTASTDYGQSKDYKTHVVLALKNVPGFENVANLYKLPRKGFMVFAMPMKIGEGTGAPLRLIATVGEGRNGVIPLSSLNNFILGIFAVLTWMFM